MSEPPWTCSLAVLVRGREVLLAKRSDEREFYPGVWDFVGGHCEPGESPLAALTREMLEEVGVEPDAVKQLTILQEPDPEANGEGAYHVFVVESWRGGEPRMLGTEHSELRWADLPQALSLRLAHPEYVKILTGLLHV